MGRNRDRRSERRAADDARNKPAARGTTQRGGPAALGIGVVLMLAACAASAMLVLEHFNALSLPGCGAGSGCEQAARSVWGKLPGLKWPVSFVGLGYFAGVLAAWVISSGRLGPLRLPIATVGAAVSVFYVVVMFAGGYLCHYCLAAHAANLAFCAFLMTRSNALPDENGAAMPIAGLATALVGVIGGLVIADRITGRALDQAAEPGLARTAAEIIHGATQPTEDSLVTPLDPSTQPADAHPQAKPFTGRFRFGPDPAAIRIVMLTDYQCVDCQRIEAEVTALLKQRTDVSLSVKHFPMCTQCNPNAPNLHANACWAARAAEAAGMLGGNDGFWKMHHWLFSQRGSFTDASFPGSLRELGFDPDEFKSVMQGPETLARVQADIKEGIDLGLYRTPMIFINGVEVKDWTERNQAVTKTVETVAAANPPPRSADADRPPPAFERCIADWREQPLQSLPADASPRTLGPANAPVRIVIYGDYQEAGTARINAVVAALLPRRPDVQYAYRHLPFDQTCNPLMPRTLHPFACRAAQGAEAAASLAGEDAFWRMHAHLFANHKSLSDDALRDGAAEAGIDADALMAALSRPDVAAAIQDDVRTGRAMLDAERSPQLKGIPMVFVNGRRVPRLFLAGLPDAAILERIAVEAAKSP